MQPDNSNSPQLHSALRKRAIRDVVYIFIVCLPVLVLASFFDLNERLDEFLDKYEEWDLDEMFVLALYFTVSLAIFSLRRIKELKGEIAEHEKAKAELQVAHDTLDAKVLERTEDLRLANERMHEEINERKIAEVRLKGLNRVNLMLSEINQAIVRIQERETLLREVCRIAVEFGQFRAALVGTVDGGSKVRLAAQCGFDGFADGLAIHLSAETEGRHPMETAIKEGRHSVCNDISEDPRMVSWRGGALKLGFRSLGVFPLFLGGGVAGTFNVYSSEPHFFDKEELVLLDEVSGDISFALENIDREARRKQAEERLARNALYDQLTGLPNRALFMDRLNNAIARSERQEGYIFAVLFLDLDRFKLVNESLGRAAGDRLLIATGKRLEACLRQADTVARAGGDEFAILMDDIKDITATTRLAERIIKEMKSPFDDGQQRIYSDVSIGVALNTTVYPGADEFLRDAEAAMYRAKSTGGARYEMADRRLHENAMARLRLEADLRMGLERGEFEVYYQPFASLKTGGIVGVEALVRWRHPERGLLLPPEFISVAEDTGLIVEMGELVMQAACGQVRQWHKAGHELKLAVNFSSRQFELRNLPELVSGALDKTGFPPGLFELEITEGTAMKDTESTIKMLNELRSTGVEIAIDDFGIGYSSLEYLRRFRINKLKIDKSFVDDVAVNPEASDIVIAIITLAHSQRLRVIAEGVEKEEQLDFLRRNGCDEIQGFLFSRPLPADGVEAFLRQGSRLGQFTASVL